MLSADALAIVLGRLRERHRAEVERLERRVAHLEKAFKTARYLGEHDRVCGRCLVVDDYVCFERTDEYGDTCEDCCWFCACCEIRMLGQGPPTVCRGCERSFCADCQCERCGPL